MQYRKSQRVEFQDGIALGLILFIIAILAILGAALAAGIGSFYGNTNAENNKLLAQRIITDCESYQRAVQFMVMNNFCDYKAIDFTPNGSAWPTGTSPWNTGDFTRGNGTNQAGNGQCALFDPRGGGMQFASLPNTALTATTSGQYSNDLGANDTAMSAFAGYPIFYAMYCANNIGTCTAAAGHPNATLYYQINYINYDVCTQINTILNISKTPNQNEIQANPSSSGRNLFAGFNTYYNLNGAAGGATFFPYLPATTLEGCGWDYDANSPHPATSVAPYSFLCTLYYQ